MRYIIFSLISYVLFFESCGKPRCNNDSTKAIDSTIIKYFGKYKPNNWWFFENMAKNKKDSVFMGTGFFDLPQPNDFKATDCDRIISGKLVFLHLGNILNRPDNFRASPSGLSIDGMDVKLRLSDDKKKILNELGSLLIIDSFRLPPDKTFMNVWKIENSIYEKNHVIYVAPDVGIIRIESKTDTFILNKFKVN